MPNHVKTILKSKNIVNIALTPTFPLLWPLPIPGRSILVVAKVANRFKKTTLRSNAASPKR